MDRRDRRSPSRSRSPRRDGYGDRGRRDPSPQRRDRSRERSPPRSQYSGSRGGNTRGGSFHRDDGRDAGRDDRDDYRRPPRDDARGERRDRGDWDDPRERDLWKTKEERRREPSAGSDVPREMRRPLPGPSRGPARGPEPAPRLPPPADAAPASSRPAPRETGPAMRGEPDAPPPRGDPSRGGGADDGDAAAPKPPVEKPDFGLSGALAKDAGTGNVYNGVLLKFSEPPEARPPTQRWRLHVFKGDTQLEAPLHVHRQSAYLAGRDRRVADIPTDHPSCSSQHAVLQYRLVELPADPGDMGPPVRVVKPYVIDLESTNGTFVNGERIPGARYYELKAGDVLKFGLSSREYVLLHDEMAGGGR